jgi:hypothetical protein
MSGTRYEYTEQSGKKCREIHKGENGNILVHYTEEYVRFLEAQIYSLREDINFYSGNLQACQSTLTVLAEMKTI